MCTRIAVRLPDDLVEFVDRMVTSGKAPSRTAVVAWALGAERRREAARRDARIYAESAVRDDLDALAAWAGVIAAPDQRGR